MEAAFAAIGKIFSSAVGALTGSAGTAAASTAATAGSTAAAGTGAAASSAGASVLQGIGTAVKILGTIGSGMAAASYSRDMAAQADLEAGQEQVQSVQRQTAMKQELLRVLGENDVAFASAGIDLSGGAAQSTAQAAKKRAAQELSIERSDSDFQKAMLRIRASSLRRRASSEVGGALLGAIGQGVDYGISLAQRG